MPRPVATTALAPALIAQESSATPSALLRTVPISMPGPSIVGSMNRTRAFATGLPSQSVTRTRVGNVVPAATVRLASLGSTYAICAGSANWNSVTVRGSWSSRAAVSDGAVGARTAGLDAQVVSCGPPKAGPEDDAVQSVPSDVDSPPAPTGSIIACVARVSAYAGVGARTRMARLFSQSQAPDRLGLLLMLAQFGSA